MFCGKIMQTGTLLLFARRPLSGEYQYYEEDPKHAYCDACFEVSKKHLGHEPAISFWPCGKVVVSSLRRKKRLIPVMPVADLLTTSMASKFQTSTTFTGHNLRGVS